MPSPLTDDAFLAAALIADLETVERILTDFFGRVTPADWERPTEKSGRGWTLRQTLAHVSAVAEVYYQAMDDTLHGIQFSMPGVASYKDLAAFNAREIARR